MKRSARPPEVSLQPEFAPIVNRLEGMTAVEIATGFDSLHTMTRLGRGALRSQLPSIMVLALAKVM